MYGLILYTQKKVFERDGSGADRERNELNSEHIKIRQISSTDGMRSGCHGGEKGLGRAWEEAAMIAEVRGL
ncbi:hypothetical protein BgiMline_026378 [Biomphalaria glabrata]